MLCAADARVCVLALELQQLVNLLCASDLHVRARAGAPPPCCEAMDTARRRRCVREQEICEEEDKGHFRQERGKVANTHYNLEFSPKNYAHCISERREYQITVYIIKSHWLNR